MAGVIVILMSDEWCLLDMCWGIDVLSSTVKVLNLLKAHLNLLLVIMTFKKIN